MIGIMNIYRSVGQKNLDNINNLILALKPEICYPFKVQAVHKFFIFFQNIVKKLTALEQFKNDKETRKWQRK